MTKMINLRANAKDEILFAKLREDAKIPTKRDEDGCYDLYGVIPKNESGIEDDIIIAPHTTKLIPTGICSAFDPKYRIVFHERGSNTKWCAIVQAGIIDSGYRGEYFVAIHNGNDIPIWFTSDPNVEDICKSDDRIIVPTSKAICQFSVEEVPKVVIREVTVDEIRAISSERGTGALGSSGK